MSIKKPKLIENNRKWGGNFLILLQTGKFIKLPMPVHRSDSFSTIASCLSDIYLLRV